MTTTDTEVTQADRIAAADVYRQAGDSLKADMARIGKWDDGYMVQAFARHRTLTPAQAAGPVLLKALKGAQQRECMWWCNESVNDHTQHCRKWSAAITQTEGPQA